MAINLNVPSQALIEETAANLATLIRDREVLPASLWGVAPLEHSTVIQLWWTDIESAHRLFGALRGIAGNASHWSFNDIRSVFAATTFEKLADNRARKEREAEPPEAPDIPKGTLTRAQMIVLFNLRYVHLFYATKEWVMRVSDEEMFARRAFLGRHPEPVIIGYEEGEPILRETGITWLKSPSRTLAGGGLVFDPTLPHGLHDDPKNDNEKIYNTWSGFAVEPKQGNWSKLRRMIFTVLCGGHGPAFRYLMQWLARLVQKPAAHGEVAVVMGGEEGVGKGTLGRLVASWFGKHGGHFTQDTNIVGRFNDHLQHLAYIFCDEVFFANDKRAFAILKALITEPTFMVEIKNGAIFPVVNHLSLLLAGNPEHLVQAGVSARRYFVLRALDLHRDDPVYWTEINNEIKNGASEAMLHFLKNLDISEFDHRKVPYTDALAEQKLLTMRREPGGWWLDVLTRGHVYESQFRNEAMLHCWHTRISTKLLYAGYLQWARKRGIGGHEIRSDTQLGIFLGQKLKLDSSRRLTNAIIAENPPNGDDEDGDKNGSLRREPRSHGYGLPDLPTARAEFETYLKIHIAWPALDDEPAEPELPLDAPPRADEPPPDDEEPDDGPNPRPAF
jgi:hypothetical protein